jgi:hypothetical protein
LRSTIKYSGFVKPLLQVLIDAASQVMSVGLI